MDNTILYGRSIPSIADQLYSHENWTVEKKNKQAQFVYDSVLNAFPALRKFMVSAQKMAHDKGYVETILGRRRHIRDMMLPEYEFKPMDGYVNPDIDPLDPSTFTGNDGIPQRIQDALYKELTGYKYFGQKTKRIKQLAEEDKIKVISNSYKIQEASRQCVNCTDFETEILTSEGWKHYDEVSIGDEILAYSPDSNTIVRDTINDVMVYEGEFDTVEFKSQTFSAVTTSNHRWICDEKSSNHKRRIVVRDTSWISRLKSGTSPIIRVADNDFSDNPDYSDSELKLYGWYLTDGYGHSKPYHVRLYQSANHPKGLRVYTDMIDTISRLGIDFTDKERNAGYHEVYLKKCAVTEKMLNLFPDRKITVEFINKLSQRQANILINAFVDGDGTTSATHTRSVVFGDKDQASLFQMLCFIGGFASSCITTSAAKANEWIQNHNKKYTSISNTDIVHINRDYHNVSIYKVRRAQICKSNVTYTKSKGVWCVSTNTHSWIARRNGFVYVTGNSIIQGSAAELTKMAMLKVEADPVWQNLGGRILVPVHDEFIAEVPIEHWKEGGDRLAQLMCEAANFLPFSIKCDVTTSYRWYGLEYPCPYPETNNVDTEEPEEVKYIQYHLFEVGYELPVFKGPNGEKPEGNEALGVNGRITDEYLSYIQDYCNRYNIQKDQFLHHIHTKVHTGYTPDELKAQNNSKGEEC